MFEDTCSKLLLFILIHFKEHTGRVFRLQFDEFQIVSSSHDDTILIWDFLNTGPNNAHLPGTSNAPPQAAHHRRAPPVDGMFDGQAGNGDFGADPGVGMGGGINIPGPLLQAEDEWDNGHDAHMQVYLLIKLSLPF